MRIYFGAIAEGGVSVSLSRGGAVFSVVEGKGTDDLLALLARALKSAKAKKSDIEEIAVDRGPGGFSAVRRRVAVATGLARSLDAKIAPVDEMSPEEAAALPASAFAERALVAPIYAGEPNITISKKKKTWTAH
jgi:tRNA A37 threonylcarbamoyladenosine modification protein TsaB